MNHPVRLSDTLVLDARLTGRAVRRSIAGQIEFWANLGKAIEPLLQGNVAMALSRAGTAKALADCLDTVDTAQGRERLDAYLETRPYPHYEPATDNPGLLVRIDEDGTRTLGRFVNREFRPVETA